MGVRLFVGILLAVFVPGLARAADCITARQAEVAIVKGASCAELRLMSRKRDDQRPNVDVAATWIEFAIPAGPGEWRYNDWIRRQIASVNFDKPVVVAPEQRSEDRFTIRSLYRSDRLISARYARWVRYGNNGGNTIYESVNVDLTRWTLWSPDDLVSLGGAASACWRRFADENERGAAFMRDWPLERPWTDRDFEIRPVGPRMRELIGPMVIDPKPSKERTRRVFVAALENQARWSFGDRGATVDFGDLLGPEAGVFVCDLPNAELRAIARAGAAIPP